MKPENSFSLTSVRPQHHFLPLYKWLLQESLFLPILLLYAFSLLVVSPVGEFPLVDDWIFAKAVQNLLKDGFYTGHPYLNATLVIQTYWGALFCKLFGFSFTSLRLSTLALSVLSSWMVARCGITLGFPRNLSLLSALVFATSPLFLGLSYSFMTDVPTVAFSAVSGLFFLKALRSPNLTWIFLGSFFAVIAFFVRQFGIVMPVAFFCVSAVLWWFKQYPLSWSKVGVLFAPWTVAFVLYRYLKTVAPSGTPTLGQSDHLWMMLLDIIRYFPIVLCYLSFFALPLGIGGLWQLLIGKERWSRRQNTFFLAFCGISLFCFLLPQILLWVNRILFKKESVWLEAFPYRLPLFSPNYLMDLGLGVESQFPNINPQPLASVGEGWWIPTLLSVAIAAFLCLTFASRLEHTWRQIRERRPINIQDKQVLFLIAWVLVVILLLFNPWRSFIFERYFLPALLPVILLSAIAIHRYFDSSTLKIVLLSGFLVFVVSLSLVQDQLAWNRTAWVAQETLVERDGISPEVIRGTDAFNGWHNSEKFMQVYSTRNWFDSGISGLGPWVLDDQYWVTNEGNHPGYEVLERYPYLSWLGFQERAIVSLKRTTAK